MWSDRLSPSCRRELAEQLRRALPAPRTKARHVTAALGSEREPAAVAEALWPEPDFVWFDRPGESRIFLDPIARLTVCGGRAVVSGPGGEVHAEARGFDLIEAALEAWGRIPGALLCGYLGYELGSELEEVAQPERCSADPPDLHLGLYDWGLEFREGGWVLSGTDAWRGEDGLAVSAAEARGFLETAARNECRRPHREPITSRPNARGYEAAVARTVERIYQGELFQVNLCRKLETLWPGDALWPLYRRLRAISPASEGALLRTGPASGVLSVSPEMFLTVDSGVVRSCPIKGTRPRGETLEEDRELAAALLASEKDRAELAMIVDVTRNDLGRVCVPGSVAVARHAELMTLPTVHHTYSEVTGRLRADAGPADLLRAAFPPASISGAPKIRAMEIAADEEGFRRGPSMGGIGWLSLEGDMHWSVAIRTAMAAEDRLWYLAGCGITAESVPEEELAESEAKAAAFLRALESAGADR